MDNKRILVVDDVEFNRQTLREILEPHYEVVEALDGFSALDYVFYSKKPPDLVLLDTNMPGMDGFEVLSMIRSNPAVLHVPVIFTSASDVAETEGKSLLSGAGDFIAKPVRPDVVLARVRNQLELVSFREEMQGMVDLKMRELLETQEDMLRVLASLIEFRDSDYVEHMHNTAHYAQQMVHGLMEDSPYKHDLIHSGYELILKAMTIHDIGMIGVPDSILLKPSRLDFGEYEIIKRHTVVGSQIIASMRHAHTDPFLLHCYQIARYHHERWDGTGYPDGLAEVAIPLAARIVSVVDVYDALVSARAYKAPMSPSEALAYICAAAGTQFDPTIVETFARIHPQLHQLRT